MRKKLIVALIIATSLLIVMIGCCIVLETRARKNADEKMAESIATETNFVHSDVTMEPSVVETVSDVVTEIKGTENTDIPDTNPTQEQEKVSENLNAQNSKIPTSLPETTEKTSATPGGTVTTPEKSEPSTKPSAPTETTEPKPQETEPANNAAPDMESPETKPNETNGEIKPDKTTEETKPDESTEETESNETTEQTEPNGTTPATTVPPTEEKTTDEDEGDRV